MATFTFGAGGFTLDESPLLQDGSGVFPATEDNNDDDVAIGSLPAEFSALLFGAADADSFGLSTTFPTDIGVGASADDYIQVAGDGGTDVTDLNFSKAAGGGLPVFGDGAPLVSSGIFTTGGDQIYLFSDDDNGTVAAAGLLGKVALGGYDDGSGNFVIAFALYLVNTDTDGDDNLTDWKVYSVQMEPLAHGSPGDGSGGTYDEALEVANLGVAASEEIFFNFANTPAGKLYFAMYVQAGTAQNDASAVGILATSDDPPNSGFANNTTNAEKTEGNKHLNTSKGGGPTTHGVENQSTGQNESLTYSLVVNPNRNFVINQPTSGENVTEGAIDGNSSPLGIESNIQFDSYFAGAPGGFFTVVKVSGGGGGSRTTIDVAAFLNTDNTDKGSNYDNAQTSATGNQNAGGIGGPTKDGVRDGDEVVQQIESIRIFSVALNKEGFVVDGSKVLLFDSDLHANGHNGIHVINLGTDKVSIAGIPENGMVEFDLEAGDLWNMLEISKSVPDGNYSTSNPFAQGQTFNIANVGVASADIDPEPLPGVRFEDDGPAVDVVADVDPGELEALHRNLDETIDPDNDQINDGADNYADGDTPDNNGDLDDVPSANLAPRNQPIWDSSPGGFDAVGPEVDQAIGRLSTSAGQLSALFGDPLNFVDFGTDGEGDLGSGDSRSDTLSFVLSTSPVKTNLVATAVVGEALDGVALAGREIYLVQVSSTVIEGRVKGGDGVFDGLEDDDYVILRLTLTNPTDPANATIVSEQFAPVQHPIVALSDEAISLLIDSLTDTLSVRWTTEAEDGDEDTDSDFADVVLIDDTNTIVSIDDDGPHTTGIVADIPLWEDGLAGGSTDNDGEPEVTTNATPVDLKDQVIGGSDGVSGFGLSTDVSSLTGLGLTSGGVALSYVVDQDFNVAGDDRLTASANGTTIFTVVVTEDGLATATLLGPLDHPQDLLGQPDEDEIIIDLTDLLEAFEGDNDLVQFEDDALRLVVEDDAPEVNVEDTSLNASDTTATYSTGAQGDWSDAPGADGFGSLAVTFDEYQINANGFVTATPSNSTFGKTGDFTFAGSITDDFNGNDIDDTVSFTLTFNNDGTYDVVVTTPPGGVTTFDTSQGTLAPGGPDAVQTLLFGGNPPTQDGNDDIVFFGAVATAPREDGPGGGVLPNDIEDLVVVGEPDLTESQIEAFFVPPPNQIPTLINSATQMNVSTSGIGINNNNLDSTASTAQGEGAFAGTTITPGDESFVVNPEPLVDSMKVYISSTVQGYNPVTEDLYYTVYFADGSVSALNPVEESDLTRYANNQTTEEGPDGTLQPLPKEAKGGSSFVVDGGDKKIDAVQLTMGQGTIKIPIIAFTIETDFDPESLDMRFTAEEFDGEPEPDSDTDTFEVNFEPDPI